MIEKFTLAQISDCHLYKDKKALHHGANVYLNLCSVLMSIRDTSNATAIVFTGDLTQDHSEQSYINFVDAIKACNIEIPVYYVAGNHDEPELLQRYLDVKPFCNEKKIEISNWQVLLVESKSNSPSGKVTNQSLEILGNTVNEDKSQLIFMHHHAKNVEYFIDRHGLTNKGEFYQFLSQYPSISHIACGHVHQALSDTLSLSTHEVQLFTCPATSIQFDTRAKTVCSNGQPPGYRIFTLDDKQQLVTEAVFI